jgi:hypothetical protein
MHRLLMTAVLASLLTTDPAFASSWDGKPKILLHVRPTTAKNQCAFGSLSDCMSANPTGAVGNDYFVYLSLALGDVPALLGFMCGVTYDTGAPTAINDGQGIDVWGWTICGPALPGVGWPAPHTYVFTEWPHPCPTAANNCAGYFSVTAYSPSVMRLEGRPDDGKAVVFGCPNGNEIVIPSSDLGSAIFTVNGIQSGCNPCVSACPENPITVEASTWSRVKTLR